MKITMASARVNAGLKQNELSQLMNVSQNSVIDWEKGRKYPRVNELYRFCDIVNCPIEQILFEGINDDESM